ncbi:uncharacterized protein [Drosophila kikkawai]|uniref:Uncharacterized protein n=1 Tax=Drosophila kikkawai TaxID=30033 RepID=A0A6P4I7U6_DROKI|nr:uncharacterized protein LOC108072251 [Drosophila kikkawai]
MLSKILRNHLNHLASNHSHRQSSTLLNYHYEPHCHQTHLLQQLKVQRYTSFQRKLVYGCGGGGCGDYHRELHNWDRHSSEHEERRKTIPKLVYLHNPWKYLLTKLNLWKLKWLWDREFRETEFVEGAKQAAVVLTDIIRLQQADRISDFTTPVGFQQITRDMLLSRNDTRLQLVRFQREHLRRAIPMKVATRQNFGRKYAFIDMLFVGLRNTKDFDTATEVVEVNDIIRRMDNELRTPPHVVAVPHRIVFAEIFIRFRRDYTAEARREILANKAAQIQAQARNLPPNLPQDHSKTPASPFLQSAIDAMSLSQDSAKAQPMSLSGRVAPGMDDVGWSVSFYKILTFDVLNYDPNPGRHQHHQSHDKP